MTLLEAQIPLSPNPEKGPALRRAFLSSLGAGALAGLVVLLVTCLSGVTLYLRSQRALAEQARAGLLRTAATAAAVVDGDVHRRFYSRAQEKSRAYLRAVAPLERVVTARSGIQSISTCVLKHGRVFFVLDRTAHIMQPCPGATPEMLRALRTGQPGAEALPPAGGWDAPISGYAPLFDSHRRQTGIVVVEMTAGRCGAHRAGLRRAAGISLLLGLGLALLAGVGVFLFRRAFLCARFAESEAAATLRPAGDLLEQRVQERTRELTWANETLKREVAARREAESGALQLNAQLERRLQRLAALNRIDTAVTDSQEAGAPLEAVLDEALAQLGVDAACISLLEDGRFCFAAGQGFRSTVIHTSPLWLEQAASGRPLPGRRVLRVFSTEETWCMVARAAVLVAEGFVSCFAVPLVVGEQIQGLLEVFHRSPLSPDPEWLDFLETLSGRAALLIASTGLFCDLQRSRQELAEAYDATIEGWARVLDLRDQETEGHCLRVADLTLRLAWSLGLPEEDLIHIRRGALLHDIGNMGVPEAILLKPGPLTGEEWEVVRCHPAIARDMLWPIAFLRPALDIPIAHHEKWDGTGYPQGLCGNEIPLAARLFALADVWDALRSDRPYRAAWPFEQVCAHIQSLAGTHFQPDLVDVFLQIVQEDALAEDVSEVLSRFRLAA